MKRLFTLMALLAMFLGANSKTVIDTEFSYSDISDWAEKGGFASNDAKSRLSLEDGCLYFHSEEAVDPFYSVQFQAFGVRHLNPNAEYTIEFRIKGSVAQNIRAYFSGSDAPGEFALTTDWQILTFKCKNNAVGEFFANSGMVLFQCGDYVGDWWISNVKITHEEEDKPVEQWVELLTNGNAEKAWADPNVRFDDQAKNFTICAWGKVKNENMNANGGWDPFPAEIVEDPDQPGNHVFVVHASLADTDGEAAAWDNQFWIEAPKAMKAGRKYRVRFRYRASQESRCQTRIHYQNPTALKTTAALGDIAFTQDWQTFENEFIATNDQAGGWSIAFDLNYENLLPTNFYFDDLSWQVVKLDEGYFVAICDGSTPNYDNAVKFKQEDGKYTATIGSSDNYVSDIMISTVYGNLAAFKGGTIQPKTLVAGEECEYEEVGSAVIKLPGQGVWNITIAPEAKSIRFDVVEGDLPGSTPTAINNMTSTDNGDAVKYNLAGQRVSADYKGVVVDKKGNKYWVR
ncbi:MAG: carbohydrate binding domain-containing protein [Bacteroidaceae bacterium]|nr:carbohydrate binding domain-containing protein [Bacteroidaceae bacterium]